MGAVQTDGCGGKPHEESVSGQHKKTPTTPSTGKEQGPATQKIERRSNNLKLRTSHQNALWCCKQLGCTMLLGLPLGPSVFETCCFEWPVCDFYNLLLGPP